MAIIKLLQLGQRKPEIISWTLSDLECFPITLMWSLSVILHHVILAISKQSAPLNSMYVVFCDFGENRLAFIVLLLS